MLRPRPPAPPLVPAPARGAHSFLAPPGWLARLRPRPAGPTSPVLGVPGPRPVPRLAPRPSSSLPERDGGRMGTQTQYPSGIPLARTGAGEGSRTESRTGGALSHGARDRSTRPLRVFLRAVARTSRAGGEAFVDFQLMRVCGSRSWPSPVPVTRWSDWRARSAGVLQRHAAHGYLRTLKRFVDRERQEDG